MTNVITLNNCDSKHCDFHNKKNECTNKLEESLLPSKEEQIPCFLDDKLKTLINRKKLHLVLDLDHTLVHSIYIKDLTECDNSFLRHPHRKNWLKEGKLYMLDELILIKLRPYVRTFLEDASKMFDFSIFTLGTKAYAERVVDILDPDGVYFTPSNVFSKEDCKSPKTKGIDVLHQDEKLALVVDDNKHVWGQNPRNLIQIKPYVFFVESGKRWTSWTSWTQWRGDESEMYGELARVLKELRKIHAAFFDYSTEEEDDNVDYYKSRDVRDVVEEVREKFISSFNLFVPSDRLVRI